VLHMAFLATGGLKKVEKQSKNIFWYDSGCHTSFFRIEANMKTILVEQMELSIDKNQNLTLIDARMARAQRSRFWFNKMRQVVELAVPAKPVPLPEPASLDLSQPINIVAINARKAELEHAFRMK
jgi:hypothetical protein